VEDVVNELGESICILYLCLNVLYISLLIFSDIFFNVLMFSLCRSISSLNSFSFSVNSGGLCVGLVGLVDLLLVLVLGLLGLDFILGGFLGGCK